ncbi:MAG: isocitrate lyase/phosphoenolpyruvate mutase family protein, partial [Actinobacteria bacterium]|nr:isocitrate lyase/phosphoenolpyruvate mutase family protein [Actinomycetota bacterium]
MPADASITDHFRELHATGCFVMPNPFDVGSTRLLTELGFPALATTSSGCAASLGRLDMTVTRDEMLRHVEALVAATHLPFNVDSERLFADDAAGVAETVGLIARTGAAGCSIEDWDPVAGSIDPHDAAVERVASAAGAARASGLVLTARCENLLHGVLDLDDTIGRLCA